MTTKWFTQIFPGTSAPPPQTNPATPEAAATTAAKTSFPVDIEAANKAVGTNTNDNDKIAGEDGNQRPYDITKVDMDFSVVILLYGKNSFGDKIYSYLKITLGGIEKLKAALLVGMPFNPTDFGSIIAAGRGEPSDEVKAEISSTYYVLTAKPAPEMERAEVKEKKGWDEY
jgi:hypothetical protein